MIYQLLFSATGRSKKVMEILQASGRAKKLKLTCLTRTLMRKSIILPRKIFAY